jgi:hypothetical protein
MDETLLDQLKDDLQELFNNDTEYNDLVVKTAYEGDEDISYPYIVIEELTNTDVDRFYDGAEHVIDVAYQFTIFAEQTIDNDAITNVRIIIDKIKTYMRGERYHSLHRIGSSPDAALPGDSNVRIGYMRYSGRINIDENIIYRRN